LENNGDIHLWNNGSTSRNVKQEIHLLLLNLSISYSQDKPPLDLPADVHEGAEEDQGRPVAKYRR